MVKDSDPTAPSRRRCDEGDYGADQSAIEASQNRKKDKKRKKVKEKEVKRRKKKMKLESTTTTTTPSSSPANDASVSRVNKDQREEQNIKRKKKSSHSSSSSSSSLQESQTAKRHESGTTPKAYKKTKRKRTNQDDSQDSSPCKQSFVSSKSKEEEAKKKDASPVGTSENQPSAVAPRTIPGRPLVESSELGYAPDVVEAPHDHSVTLLLFYQYVEPPWNESVYKQSKLQVESIAKQCQVTGRMRVAREGLNCTLTGSQTNIYDFCRALRQWKPDIFLSTEFKLTHHLPEPQLFPALKLIPVTELVHYGLEGDKAPPIHRYHGIHLEPKEYHEKLAEENTVVIDVRNHYEAIIGRFDPPPRPPVRENAKGDPANKEEEEEEDDPSAKNKNHPTNQKWIDPKMRKSTEFPVWLDDPQTKEQLRGKQVLMYCTGG